MASYQPQGRPAEADGAAPQAHTGWGYDSRHDDAYVASPYQQQYVESEYPVEAGAAAMPAAPPPYSGATAEPPLPPERDRAADEAITDSLRHVVSEYARRAKQEAFDAANEKAHRKSRRLTLDEAAAACQPRDLEFIPTQKFVNDPACLGLLGATFLALSPILSTLMIVTLAVGAMATYAFDLYGHRVATMYSLIGTLVSSWVVFYFSNFTSAWESAASMLIVLSVAVLFLLTALRGVLQFHSVQENRPGFALIAEGALNALLPIAATPPIYAALIGVCGARWAPFVLAPVLCLLHFGFYLPKQSSFLEIATDDPRRADAAEHLVQLVGQKEAFLGTLFTWLLPVMVYPATTSDAWQWSFLNVCNAWALICGPLLYFVVMDPKVTLWFAQYWQVQKRVDEATGVVTIVSALDVVYKARWAAAGLFYTALMHFSVERLVNSRFAYLFVGIPPPFNYVVLVAAGYIGSGILGLGLYLVRLDNEEHAESEAAKQAPSASGDVDLTAQRSASATVKKRRTNLQAFAWVSALLLAVIFAIAVGVVTGMPGFFLPMSALSAACFMAYLVDRRSTNHYVTFVCSTVITLTWWMFKTFSFLRQDLRVIGDAATVSTTEVAGALLMAYMLGAALVPLAFSQNKAPLVIVAVLHGLKVTFIEHVLYSQQEAGVYSGFLVLATSVIGCVVSLRMFKNGVMPETAAAYIMGLYASKFFVYLVEINTVGQDADSAFENAVELAVTHLFSMAACAVCAMCELRHRAGVFLNTKQFAMITTSVFLVLAFGMRSTVLKLAVQWIGFSDPTPAQLFAAAGIACGAFGFFFASRYTARKLLPDGSEVPLAARAAVAKSLALREKIRRMLTYIAAGSFALLLADPPIETLLFGEPEAESVSDNPYTVPWWCRWSLFAAGLLLVAGLRAPLHLIHPVVRGAFFVLLSIIATLAGTPLLVPTADFSVGAALCVFLATAAATMVACHHGNFDADVCLIMYLVSLVSLAVGFVALNYVPIAMPSPHEPSAAIQSLYIAEAHSQSRVGLLVIGIAVNLFMAFALKCYLNGRPLLSGARKLQGPMGSQVALVLNYATILGYATLCLLAFWIEADTAGVLVAGSPLLLLLHNDGLLVNRLHKGPFRYFPPFLAACATLLWQTQLEIREEYAAGRAWHVCVIIISLLALVPSQLVAGRFLFAQRKRTTTVLRIVLFALMNFIVLLLTPSHAVRWLAVVGVLAHVGRLSMAGHLGGSTPILG